MAEPALKPPSVTVLLGPQAGREIPLLRAENTLGSDAACDVALNAPGVAAIHARIRLSAGGARLSAEPGALGLYRNDDPVAGESALASGDVVWLGSPGAPGSVMLQCRISAGLAAYVAQLTPVDEFVVDEPPGVAQPEAHEPELVAADEEATSEAEPAVLEVEAVEAGPEPEAIEAPDEAEATMALSVSPFAVASEPERVDFAETVVDVAVPGLEPEAFEATLVDMAPLPVSEAEQVPAKFTLEPPGTASPFAIEEDLEEEVVQEPPPEAEATVMLARPAPAPAAAPVPAAPVRVVAPDPDAEYAATVSLKRSPLAASAPAVSPRGVPETAPAKPVAPARPPAAPRSEAARPRPAQATPGAAPRPAAPAATGVRKPAPATAPRPVRAAAPASGSTPMPMPAPVRPAAPASKAALWAGLAAVVVAAAGGLFWISRSAPSPPPSPVANAPVTTLAPPLPPPASAPSAPVAAPSIVEEAAVAVAVPRATPPPPLAAARSTNASTAAAPRPAPAKAAPAQAPPAKAAPAVPEVDPNQARAQQVAGLLERAKVAQDARQYEPALVAYQEALKLDPGNARATSGVQQVEAAATAARRRFVAGRSFFLAKPSGKAPAGFNTQDVTVANPDYSARLDFASTPEGVRAGDRWQVQVFAVNDGKKAIRFEKLAIFVTQNGSRASVPATLKTRELAPRQRALLGDASGNWGEAVKSWSLDVVASTSRDETLKGSVAWK